MLTDYAKRELELAGLFDKDSDYEGGIGKAVMELVEVFSAQGHSGASAAMVMQVFQSVTNFTPLTPLTSNPDDWFQYDENQQMWQCKRAPSVFSADGGKTWYDLDGKLAPTREQLEKQL